MLLYYRYKMNFVQLCCTLLVLLIATDGYQQQLFFHHVSSAYMLEQDIESSWIAPCCMLITTKVYPVHQESVIIDALSSVFTTHEFDWSLGVVHPQLAIQFIDDVTKVTFMCFNGPGTLYRYTDDLDDAKFLQKWLRIVRKQSLRSPNDARTELLDQCKSENRSAVIVVTDNSRDDTSIANSLQNVSQLWKKTICTFITYTKIGNYRSIVSKYKVKKFPTIVLDGSKDFQLMTYDSSLKISFTDLHLKLLKEHIPADHIDNSNIVDIVTYKPDYVPILLCVYMVWSPNMKPYLSAFHRSAQDFTELGLHLRFGLLEINQYNHFFLINHLRPGKSFPYVVLIRPERSVTGDGVLEQIHMESDLPSPAIVYEFLLQQQHAFLDHHGNTLIYRPWGQMDHTQITAMSEGPVHGCFYSKHFHNETEHWGCTKHLHADYGLDTVVAVTNQSHHLHKTDRVVNRSFADIKYLDRLMWADTVATSHATQQDTFNLYKPQSNKIKLTLVIFIRDKCHQCARNMQLFQEVKNSMEFIGGAAYLFNCSSDPDFCKQQNISGFPTLFLYRGYGQLTASEACMRTMSDANPYVRMSYHGTLQVKTIMKWVSTNSIPAVQYQYRNTYIKMPQTHIVASILPRTDEYLSGYSGSLGTRQFYPYNCLRIVCEKLYGAIPCISHISQYGNVENSQKSLDDHVVLQLSLHRSDNVTFTMMRALEPLDVTLKTDDNHAIHYKHKTHRHNLPPRYRCEDDHTVCSDYVVNYTNDHSRLPISYLTYEMFHSTNNVLLTSGNPVLIAFVHLANLTAESSFRDMLLNISLTFYDKITMLSVNVDEYTNWSNQFVPRGYSSINVGSQHAPLLYHYPRFCMVDWTQHTRAAFYPPPPKETTPMSGGTVGEMSSEGDARDVSGSTSPKTSVVDTGSTTGTSGGTSEEAGGRHVGRAPDITREGLQNFVEEFLQDPEQFWIETEHF